MAAVCVDVVDWLWLIFALHYCGYPSHQSYDVFATGWYRSKCVHSSDITLSKLLMIYCLVDRFKLIASDVGSVSRKLRRWITISAYSRFAAFVSIFVDSRLVPHADFILHLFRTLIYHVLSLSYTVRLTPSRASAGCWLGGLMPSCRLRRIFFFNLTTKWCILKYIWKKYVVSIAPFTPLPPPIQKTALLACFRFLIFHPLFQGVS